MIPKARIEILRKAEYHASELSRCLERLEDIDKAQPWQQAAKLSRGVRALVRVEVDRHRGRRGSLR